MKLRQATLKQKINGKSKKQQAWAIKDKTGKIFLSRAKENTVELRTDAGGRVEIFLTHLTR